MIYKNSIQESMQEFAEKYRINKEIVCHYSGKKGSCDTGKDIFHVKGFSYRTIVKLTGRQKNYSKKQEKRLFWRTYIL